MALSSVPPGHIRALPPEKLGGASGGRCAGRRILCPVLLQLPAVQATAGRAKRSSALAVPLCLTFCHAAGRRLRRRAGRPRRSTARLRSGGVSLEEFAAACDNTFTRDLPADFIQENFVREVSKTAYSRVRPTRVSSPRLVAYSDEVASDLLGLSAAACESSLFPEVFSGNRVLAGFDPHATVYAGHQWGSFAGQLGDGRAITLGEALGPSGQRWEVQLKGAGLTPYSREADGRAMLRSSVREFLMSEAMHGLGVPTTRALSLVSTGDDVVRGGRQGPRAEKGAVVCRVAPSFVRFGHFEHFDMQEERDELRALADHVLWRHFPEFYEDGSLSFREKVASMFQRVCVSAAHLVAEWQRVGFVHGVLNTDNMSICGLSLDYGPFGMLEEFDPEWTPNLTDAKRRRYCFKRQPEVVQWNLVKLGQALLPLCGGDLALLNGGIRGYAPAYRAAIAEVQRRKLGLREAGEDAEDLWNCFEGCLTRSRADYTVLFRQLAAVPVEEVVDDAALLEPLEPAFYEALATKQRDSWLGCLRFYAEQLRREGRDPAERAAEMRRANPKVVPRSWILQQAADMAEAGEPALVQELLRIFRDPYSESSDGDTWAGRRPNSAHNPALS